MSLHQKESLYTLICSVVFFVLLLVLPLVNGSISAEVIFLAVVCPVYPLPVVYPATPGHPFFQAEPRRKDGTLFGGDDSCTRFWGGGGCLCHRVVSAAPLCGTGSPAAGAAFGNP